MKTLSPLLVTLLLTISHALAAEWSTLSGIGDEIELKAGELALLVFEIELKAGELALLVSASEPSYVIVDKPGRQPLALTVRPERDDFRLFVGTGLSERDEVVVSWNRPFAVAGPCVIKLRTPAALTLRHLGRSRPKP